MYRHKATGLIGRHMNLNDIPFRTHYVKKRDIEGLVIAFSVEGSPAAIPLWFFSCDDSNSVAARVLGLIRSVPKEKYFRLMAVCNELNGKRRYMKYHIDEEGDIRVEYDFPETLSDQGVGIVALETRERFMYLLNKDYTYLIAAIETGEDIISRIRSETDSVERESGERLLN